MTAALVRAFSDIGLADIAEVGGKNASLGEIGMSGGSKLEKTAQTIPAALMPDPVAEAIRDAGAGVRPTRRPESERRS